MSLDVFGRRLKKPTAVATKGTPRSTSSGLSNQVKTLLAFHPGVVRRPRDLVTHLLYYFALQGRKSYLGLTLGMCQNGQYLCSLIVALECDPILQPHGKKKRYLDQIYTLCFTGTKWPSFSIHMHTISEAQWSWIKSMAASKQRKILLCI